MPLAPLPIDEHLPRIVEAVRRHRAAVIVAEPGAGKTTRVPPALLELGRVALLQPRRVAARSLARRIAEEQRLVLGEDVGWHVRFERKFTHRTRLLVMTEGILTARLQSDPLLEDFAVVVLDEFHERSLHADLALALARQAQLARGDLSLVVMSATIDAAPVAAFLGGAPVVEVPGRLHPVSVEHADLTPAAAIRRVLERPGGDVLCFLPGAGEIRRAQQDLGGVAADVLPLHGSLPPEEQDRALAPASRRKVVLATNVAETSLTIDSITDVVDSGQVKVLRFDPETGLDRLALERIPSSSATQRAGRAGRTAPGRALRLWDPRLQLRPFLEPEIARVDLAAPFLEVLAWGADPLELEWFEAPPEASATAAMQLLARLGAVEGRKLTELGQALRRFPLHPRLARVLVEAGGSPRAAMCCALLAERLPPRTGSAPTTPSDVLSLADDPSRLPFAARESAREIAATARRVLPGARAADDDDSLRRALLSGFVDRVARRREPRSAKLLLASGTGATLGPESGVRDAEWLLALDVQRGADTVVRVASAVERAWLQPDSVEVVHRLQGRSVRALRVERLGALVLAEREVPPEPEAAQALLIAELSSRALDEADAAWMRRARFAGVDVDASALFAEACAGRTSLPDGGLASLAPRGLRAQVDRLAPEVIGVPSGRALKLDYRSDGTVALPVKLQELFGLAETPRVGPRAEPVLLELLSPAGRPVQSTRDLRSFWERTYPEVRRELRPKYPRHPWPDDPWSATPTHRAKPREPRR
jgi:ATP-dependent helicase HrpB